MGLLALLAPRALPGRRDRKDRPAHRELPELSAPRDLLAPPVRRARLAKLDRPARPGLWAVSEGFLGHPEQRE